jgi:hypothetical protein
MSSIGHAHFIRVSLPCNNVRLWNMSMKQSQCSMSSNYYTVCLSWATREICCKKSLIYGLHPVCPRKLFPPHYSQAPPMATPITICTTRYTESFETHITKAWSPARKFYPQPRKGPTCRSTIVHHSKPLGGV